MIKTDGVVRSLSLRLEMAGDSLRVGYQLEGVRFAARAVVASLPVRIAGVPAIPLAGGDLDVVDDDGPVGIWAEIASPEDPEGSAICWHAIRATRGVVRVTYRARARVVDGATSDGHPPVDLRTEARGVTGSGRAFLALPPLDGQWDLAVRWVLADERGMAGVCSFGAGDLELGPRPLEALLDCHFMAGQVTTVEHPCWPVSVHYLTRPSFDARAFAERTAQMNGALSALFQQSPPPFRVFLRRNPYQGISGSALPHCFVAGWNEQSVRSAEDLEAFIDHELVHEWVHLDGPYEETVWHNEGLADYYGIVVPFREGLISEQSFLSRVNLQARLGYASPYRHVPLRELARLYWSDFRAQQEPYYRGFFYFTRLDFALRSRSRHGRTLDDLIRQLRDQLQSGTGARVGQWQSLVDAELGEEGERLLNEVLLGSMLPPAPSVWGKAYGCQLEQVPVIDPGFDVSTFITRTVTGLRPDGPAALAGLRDGDLLVAMPTYNDLAGHAPGQAADVTYRRGTEQATTQLQPGSDAAIVPSWHPPRPSPLSDTRRHSRPIPDRPPTRMPG